MSLFAGSWAEGLQLLGGTRLRPPVSYMGAKTSLAVFILAAMGLRPGMGAESFLLCDAGPWGWVWQLLTQPRFAIAVARILRGWRDEDPVQLWNRLAKEDPPRELVRRVATVLWLQARSASATPVWWRGRKLVMPTGARWKRTSVRSACQKGAPVKRAVQGRSSDAYRSMHTGSGGIVRTETVARRVEGISESVAKFLALQDANALSKPIIIGGGGGGRPRWRTAGYAHLSDSARARGFRARLRPDLLAGVVEVLASLDWPKMRVVHGDVGVAMDLLRSRPDLRGYYVYLDPPYVGCTSYAFDCSRTRLIEIARELSDRGAVVCISEAEPIAELVALGWDAREITHGRGGQVWQDRRVKSEWLTCNRSMLGRVSIPVQGRLVPNEALTPLQGAHSMGVAPEPACIRSSSETASQVQLPFATPSSGSEQPARRTRR